MVKKAKKLEEVVIERKGYIRDGSPVLRADVWIYPYDKRGALTSQANHDIAMAALEAGYEVGDDIVYRIVFEPKK